jgi:hypothetical protein
VHPCRALAGAVEVDAGEDDAELVAADPRDGVAVT